MKEVMEQKCNQIDEVTGSIEDNWGKVKERLLDILNNDIGTMWIAPRKTMDNWSNDQENGGKKNSNNHMSKSIGSIISWEEKLTAKTQEELQDMVNRLVDTGRKYGMEINIDKSQ